MRTIGAGDLENIARGATVLGSGGGGDPWIGRLLAEAALERHGPVRLVDPDELHDDALVLPVGVMGAPTVIVEKPPSGEEFRRVVGAAEHALGRRVTHVACLEIGGLNSMMPIVTAAQTGLPLVDGDGMGRAFPELQMVLLTVDGITASPLVMADEKGNTVTLSTIDNHWSERLARSATVDMGCSASIGLYAVSGAQARRSLVPRTLTQAGDVGRLLGNCAPGEHARVLTDAMGGRILLRGKVSDVQRRTVAGFARGHAVIDGVGDDAGARLTVEFQNENLIASRSDGVVVSTPDLISVLDLDSGRPVTTEALRFGFRVSVVGLPAYERWREPAALDLVGPRYFGYDLDHVPI